MACGQCGGSTIIPNNGGFSTCPNCSGTGKEPTGKKADWFFGDAEKNNGNNGGGFPCLTILGIMTIGVIAFAIGLWSL